MEIIPLVIILAYAYMGYKLNKNVILWGLMGLGILLGPMLLVGLMLALSPIPGFGLSVWPLASIIGPLASVIIISVIAYKNNAVFKKGIQS